MEQKPRKGFHPLRAIKERINKIGTLNFVLILVGAFFVWFNWKMLTIFQLCGAIPETYACAVVAATIGECGICGWIRTNKDRKRDRDWQKEDQREMEEKDHLPGITQEVNGKGESEEMNNE